MPRPRVPVGFLDGLVAASAVGTMIGMSPAITAAPTWKARGNVGWNVDHMVRERTKLSFTMGGKVVFWIDMTFDEAEKIGAALKGE